MELEFDPAKDAENIRKHGISFTSFEGFDEEPIAVVDDRRDYGERRVRLLGRIEGKPHCVVVTVRGRKLRLISFRRARAKEMRRYEQED